MIDPDENALPALSEEQFSLLKEKFVTEGALPAIDALIGQLKDLGDFQGLFYTMVMRKRVELGLPAILTSTTNDVPKELHEAYEDGIRLAGREAGTLYLQQGDFAKAWYFFRMLDEPLAIREAIETFEPAEEADISGVVDVAFYQDVHPIRGFAILLQQYGICNAITSFSAKDFSRRPEAKPACIQLMVQNLYQQLLERLIADLEGRNLIVPLEPTVEKIVQQYGQVLMEEHVYHIDTSHLSSVVQFSLDLQEPEGLQTARQLAIYGEHLKSTFRIDQDPPFDEGYRDFRAYLEILLGMDVDTNLERFSAKIDPEFANGYTMPAEVMVNLLLKLERRQEAVEIAKKYLAAQNRQLLCPGVYELCQQVKDYAGYTDAAQKRQDGVSFLAGLIEAQKLQLT